MRLSIATVSLCLLVGTSAMAAAQPKGSGSPCAGRACGPGRGAWQDRLYDPKTVETISGEIVSVERIGAPNGMGGVHATLRSDKGETIPVHLGPSWYLDKQSVTLAPGDQITVRGSRITFEGKPAIIAAEVTKGGQVLRLRNDNGVPVWAGWRRRGR